MSTLYESSCRVYTGPVEFIRVMSSLCESCRVYTGHVEFIRVMSILCESCRVYTGHVEFIRVISSLYESCRVHARHASRFNASAKKCQPRTACCNICYQYFSAIAITIF